ncbi:MAG TPA: DinB family protein [Terracidiphilus sp.]|nr:DinB family protein [Terracidiphilus sp.]
MFTVDGVRKLHRWTHRCLDAALDHLATLPESDYVREVPIFGFRTLRDQVVHVFNCERVWVYRLQGLPYVDRTTVEFPTAVEARRLQQEASGGTHAYLSRLTDEKLNADTELRFPDGGIEIRTPAFVIHHVLTHAFHHKGQIVAICRSLGHPAPDTDLSQFE